MVHHGGMDEDEDSGSAQDAGHLLRAAWKDVRAARQIVEQLATPSPPRDTPIPNEMKYLVRQLGLIQLAVGEFERELMKRYEVFG